MSTKYVLGVLAISLLLFGCPAAGGGGGGGGGGTPESPGAPSPTPGLPSASFTVSSTSAFVAEDLTFDPSGSAGPSVDDPLETFHWDFGDGDERTRPSDATETKSYSNAGTYNVTLTVTSKEGLTGSATQSITVSPGNPIASIDSISPATQLVGESVSFSGSGTAAPGSSISTYEWDFGDGSTPETGISPAHTYTVPSAPGRYDVSLTVTDNLGRTGTTSDTVRIHRKPVANAGSDRSVTVGGSLTFDGSGSFDPDSDGTVVSYEWDFDYSGSFSTNASGVSSNHTFDTAGTYEVALQVTDNDGAVSELDIIDVTVVEEGTNLLPVADAGGPYPAILAGSSITFDGSGSYDPDGTISSYAWDTDYDGGSFSSDLTGSSISPSFATAGIYDIALRVTDNDAETAMDVVSIVVHTEPDAAISQSSGPAGHGLAGGAISFSGAASTSGSSGDDDGDYVAQYIWDFDDGSAPVTRSVPTVAHTFANPGTYSIGLTVVDSFGETSGEESFLITIYSQPSVDIGGPYGSNTNNVFNDREEVTVDAGDSAVSATLEEAYHWDFDYDGATFDDDLTGVSGAFAAPGGPGNYTMAVRLTVREPGSSDPPLAVLIDTLPYRINASPTADAEWSAAETHVDGSGNVLGPFCGVEVTFTSTSSDTDGTIAEYLWDFGNGTTSTERNPTVVYSCEDVTNSRIYTVELRVTDNDGAGSGPTTRDITVFEKGSIDVEIQ